MTLAGPLNRSAGRAETRGGMRFRILGPMESTGEPPEERVLTPRAAKPRIVLASLLVRTDRVVSVDTLADELWGGSPPRTPTIQVYVSHLRKTLRAADRKGGRDTLVTRSPGYVLHPGPGRLDLADFEELHNRGRRALERGDNAAAADLHRRALALWRGPLLADTRTARSWAGPRPGRPRCASPPSSNASAPNSSWAATANWSASCGPWWPSTRCARSCTPT